jgi:hypothetical protein
MLNKISTRTAKTRAIPSLPTGRQACIVTAFWLKYLDPARMLRRVTQPPHIAGPLALSWGTSHDSKYFLIHPIQLITLHLLINIQFHL